MSILSIVIPAYNEESGIGQIIERVLSIRPQLAEAGVEDMELIVVDDGSTDETATIAGSYSGVHIVRHSVNQGYGAALKTGFSRAKGDLLGFLDADGTYPPEHFPSLCQAALNNDADLVIGSRMSGAESDMPTVRRIGNFIFANLVSLLGNHHVSDSASGMRVIRRSALSSLYPLPDGLNFTPVMSTRALHENIKWQEVPIPYEERDGQSKLSVVHDGTRFLYTIVWTALNYNPVRILGGIGLGLEVIAALIAAVVIGMRISGVTRLGPWGVVSVVIGSLCAVLGVTLFSLGATFNYLVSLFHKETIRQGLFGKPVFKTPLYQRFGWLGLAAVIIGVIVGIVSLSFSLGGWPIERLWFYLLGTVMSIIVGLQLIVFWIIMGVLDELRIRDTQIALDMEGKPCK